MVSLALLAGHYEMHYTLPQHSAPCKQGQHHRPCVSLGPVGASFSCVNLFSNRHTTHLYMHTGAQCGSVFFALLSLFPFSASTYSFASCPVVFFSVLCSMALGTVHGHATARPNLKVLWVDAHADINTDQTSPSGNLHGMPLGVLMQGLEGAFANMPGLDWFERKLRPEDIVYIGLRDVDDGEKEIMKRLGIKSFDNIEVEQRGVKAVVNDAMNLLKPSESQPLHLSFDIDALDPMYAPSTGTRVPFGLSREDGIYICQQVARTGALGGMDIVEVNPGLGSKLDVLKTARLAFDMVGASLGLSSAEIQDAQDEFEAVIPPLTARYGATHNMVRDLERDTTTAAPASSPAKEAEPQTEREARINHAKHSGRL
eukprot:scpid53500/ scgid10487/ Arginase-1; Liver-type arginase; Type I arginase